MIGFLQVGDTHALLPDLAEVALRLEELVAWAHRELESECKTSSGRFRTESVLSRDELKDTSGENSRKSASVIGVSKEICRRSLHLYPPTLVVPGGGSSHALSVQQRQSFASSALRQFMSKIKGSHSEVEVASASNNNRGDPSVVTPPPPLSVGEQVRRLVQEATDIDNLARMYEGWTPWV